MTDTNATQVTRIPEPRQQTAVAVPAELSIAQLVAQVEKIQQAMRSVMRDGEHFGVIPNTGGKPTLLKPGAEKLCLLFRLAPNYEVMEKEEQREPPYHASYMVRCTMVHAPTGMVMGSGLGSCSTRESKYAYRKGERTCPSCSKATIIKGKAEYGGGWVCFGKKGGCGAKFPDRDHSIESQSTERVANPDVADQWNTALKMSCKRSLVAAVLNVTAASDIFTQDLEDLADAKQEFTQPAQKPADRAWWDEPYPHKQGITWKQAASECAPDLLEVIRLAVAKKGRPTSEQDDKGWTAEEKHALFVLQRFNPAALKEATKSRREGSGREPPPGSVDTKREAVRDDPAHQGHQRPDPEL